MVPLEVCTTWGTPVTDAIGATAVIGVCGAGGWTTPIFSVIDFTSDSDSGPHRNDSLIQYSVRW